MRGAAALIVASAHAWQIFLMPYTGESRGIAVLGGLATWSVVVFFLLSGMLIGGSIENQVKRGTFSLRGYAMARFLRIYPPLVLAVLVTVGCVATINGFGLYGSESYLLPGDLASARDRASMDWGSVVTTLSLTYQLLFPVEDMLLFNGPLWSLSFEVWLYVLAGLLAFAWHRGSAVGWLASSALAAVLFVFSKAETPPFWAVSMVWGFGFLTSWLDEHHKANLTKNRKKILVAAALACLLLANLDLLAFLTAPYTGLRQHLFYVCFSVIIFFGMDSVMSRRRLENTLICRCLAWTANFSYTLYLVHFPVFLLSLSLFRPSLITHGFSGAVGMAVFSLIMVVAFSWAVASIVEDRSFLERIGRSSKKWALETAIPPE